MRRAVQALALLLCLATSGPALAWGRRGHEAVAQLAAMLIAGSRAQQQVEALLLPGETLLTAALWADCAKGYCREEPTPEMQDFVAQHAQQANYHFTDMAFQLSAYAPEGPGSSPDDVVHVLGDAIRVLQGQAPEHAAHDFSRRVALLLVVHLAGDIHQPLHVGAAYVDGRERFAVPTTRAEARAWSTQGGNLLCVRGKSLHSLWDDELVSLAMRRAQTLSSAQFARTLLARARQVAADSGAASTWPARWASDSLQVATQVLVPLHLLGRRPSGASSSCRADVARANVARADVARADAARAEAPQSLWDVRLPEDFAALGPDIASAQLAKAGARLAYLLQAIWP